MLLNNYTKEKGQSYLVETLKGPMEKVLPMVYKCEIDPLKIENQVIEEMKEKNKETDQNNNDENINENDTIKEESIDNEEVKKKTDAILKENTQNIQKSCNLLLKAITTSKKIMPSGFKSICQSLAYVIQKIYEEDNFFFSPNMLYIFDEEIYIGNIDDNSSTGSEVIKTPLMSSDDEEGSFDNENSKKRKSKIKNNNSKKNTNSTISLTINTKNLKDSYHINNDNYSNKTSNSSDLNDLSPLKSAASIYLNKVKVQSPMYDSYDSYYDLSSDSSSSESDNSSSTLSCTSIKLFIPSFEEKSAGNYLINDNDLNFEVSENSDTKEESYHADEESSIQSLIIGTLLFLRFFIPGKLPQNINLSFHNYFINID